MYATACETLVCGPYLGQVGRVAVEVGGGSKLTIFCLFDAHCCVSSRYSRFYCLSVFYASLSIQKITKCVCKSLRSQKL